MNELKPGDKYVIYADDTTQGDEWDHVGHIATVLEANQQTNRDDTPANIPKDANNIWVMCSCGRTWDCYDYPDGSNIEVL